jgi:hypothetical protein
MVAPKTDNKAIDSQATPGAEFKVQINVGLASFEALSHDPDNLGKITGLMNGEGSWSTSQIDHNGNQTSIVHGATKNAAQASHRDVSGGHDVERVTGGSHSQKKNGSNEENGEHETKAVDGATTKSSSSSDKIYSKGGDGHMHHKGDLTMMVEEGGLHYSSAKDFTVSALGSLIKLTAAKDIAIESQGSNITVTSPTQIKLQVGSSYILITPSGIEIKAAAVKFTKA